MLCVAVLYGPGNLSKLAFGCSWTTAFRWPWCFVDIGGVGWGGVGHVLTLHAGWGGACINLHVNLQMKDMLRGGCRQVQVFMGGVGWGGACINVHVNLHLATLL